MVIRRVKYINFKRIRIRMIQIGGEYMATQIAATPIIYGVEARKILSESKSEETTIAKENGMKLLNFFERITIEGDYSE